MDRRGPWHVCLPVGACREELRPSRPNRVSHALTTVHAMINQWIGCRQTEHRLSRLAIVYVTRQMR